MISNKIKQLTAFIKLQMDWLRSNNEQEEIKKTSGYFTCLL